MVNKKEAVRKEGIVIEALRSAIFKVKVGEEENEILAHPAGKLRLNHIKIIPGDKVIVELSPYDPKRGRIVYRL
ncbi:MAG: translation initiation factor IF-1 [Candidatus Paceibacterota bacterium]|jgi:translation initiation factor IF-1|nr:translation initiation factor IF-1 [Candidatus Paceibacterota bacterium]MDD3548421.1 translation initiation factor IF-1 [Candidatus Paceibacterota bacterium]MDD4999306.1 translation initiation factor IF-1 [Candidatus Paceibacterota bacterium]MDD5545360.1 translation initiation factor IF-1 [Candidatus Paceibacterota bacterium]